MTATPSPKGVEPPPSALDKLRAIPIEKASTLELFISIGVCLLDNYPDQFAKTAAEQLATLTAERDEAQKRAEVAEAALAERAKNDEQIYRNAQSILAKIHGQKSEVNS